MQRIRELGAWRDRWLLAAVTLTVASFAASEVAAGADLDLGPALVAGLRLGTFAFALLGGAAVLERERRRREQWQAAARRWQGRAESAQATWEERTHAARSALATIELAMFTAAQGPASSEWQTLVDVVRSEVSHLHRLLDGDAPPAPAVAFDVSGPVEEAVAAARVRGQQVACRLPLRSAVLGRPAAVAEVVGILLENAHRHAPGAAVVVTARAAPHEVVVRVADDGPGVPPLLAGRIMERGVSGDAGSGLGLYIAHRLAAAAGGSLRHVPTGTGAAFELSLPAVRPAASRWAELAASVA